MVLYVPTERCTVESCYLVPETDSHVLEHAFCLRKVYNVLTLNVLIHKMKQLMEAKQHSELSCLEQGT